MPENTLGKKIKHLRTSHHLRQVELANYLHISNTTLSQYENGIRIPSDEIKIKIANYFKVSVDYLLGNSSAGLEEDSPASTGTIINVYGSVPAGIPIEAIEDIVDTEEIPSNWSKGDKQYFGLRVKGDSMYPKYMDGDTIIVRKQPDCENGQDCVVYVNGYDATLKRVVFLEEGGIQLKPLNPSYAPRTYYPDDDPVQIAGVVVEIRRKV